MFLSSVTEVSDNGSSLGTYKVYYIDLKKGQFSMLIFILGLIVL